MAALTPSTSVPELVRISDKDEEGMSKILAVISSAFSTTGVTNALIAEKDNVKPSAEPHIIPSSRRAQHFQPQIEAVAKTGGHFVQAGNWSAVAVWEPPKAEPREFLDGRAWTPLLREWIGRIEVCRGKFIAGRPFWHLYFLARNPDIASVKGAISAVVMPYLERVRQDGVVAWLEATTEYAVSIYEFWGFRLVEKITFGVGRYDYTGSPAEGGEGVTAYCMIFDGHMPERIAAD